MYSQLTVDRGAKVIQWGNDSLFNINGAGIIGYPYKKKWTSIFTSYHAKHQPEMGHRLSVKSKTLKLLEKYIGENLSNIG